VSAIYNASGVMRQLDRPSDPEEQVNDDQISDETQMSRLMMGILRDIVKMKRRFWPSYLEFEDRTVDASGTTVLRLTHNFGKRVRWWVVDWSGASSGHHLVKHASSDLNTLALVSFTAGTVTVRVEESG
jgi:hypothetical protein